MPPLERLFALELEYQRLLRCGAPGTPESVAPHTSYALQSGYETLMRRVGTVPGEIVILDGWGHFEPPRPKVMCFTCFPGQPWPPPRDPVFAALLAEYLAESRAVVLADFRNRDEEEIGSDKLS